MGDSGSVIATRLSSIILRIEMQKHICSAGLALTKSYLDAVLRASRSKRASLLVLSISSWRSRSRL